MSATGNAIMILVLLVLLILWTPDVVTMITIYEDGSYVLPDGTSGCLPDHPCERN